MHKIFIKNLRLRCIIGINPDELKEKQDVVINIELWGDLTKALKTDELRDTLDYWELNRRIIGLVEDSRFNLIETLADKVADACLGNEKVSKVKVSIEKPKALKSAESVGVELTRES